MEDSQSVPESDATRRRLGNRDKHMKSHRQQGATQTPQDINGDRSSHTGNAPVTNLETKAPSPEADNANAMDPTQKQQHPAQYLKGLIPADQITGLNIALATGKFSDLLIIHNERKWQAHQVVVCSQSRFLEEMVEKIEEPKVLNLSAYDERPVFFMMEFLYTSRYEENSTEPDFGLSEHVGVYTLATKLDVPALALLAVQKYRYALNSHVSSPDVYFHSVRDVYEDGASDKNMDLRLAVVEAAVAEMRNMMEDKDLREKFFELTDEVHDFQSDVMMFMLQHPDRAFETQLLDPMLCEECGPVSEGQEYEIALTCKGCGEKKMLQIQ